MKITGQGKLLRIFVGESDSLHGQALYEALEELDLHFPKMTTGQRAELRAARRMLEKEK